MDKIRGKVVLLTGASSGIGWDAALAFAERGAKLAVCARRADKLAELGRQIRKLGAECLELACDVSSRSDIDRTVESTLKKWGRVDALINNAGINEYRRFEDLSPEEGESIVRVNLLGAMHMTQAVLPAMRRQGDGHIVNVASIAGLHGTPFMAVYCAAKHGLVGFTEALRVELYGTGVTLTAFCPGTVDTPMMEKAFSDPKHVQGVRRLAKTSRQTALMIVRCVERRPPELIYGEVPGFVLKLSRFFPRLRDWLTHLVYRQVSPHLALRRGVRS